MSTRYNPYKAPLDRTPAPPLSWSDGINALVAFWFAAGMGYIATRFGSLDVLLDWIGALLMLWTSTRT